MGSDHIRVLIADDHQIVREGLVAILGREDDVAVVAAAATGRQAVDLFHRHKPDVTLLDLRMPEMDGVEVMQAIHVESPAARFLVLTIHEGDEEVFRALDEGALGYIVKQDLVFNDLIGAVRAVNAGLRWVSPSVATRFVEYHARPRLTASEIDVLRLIATGRNNRAIATELSLPESAVRGLVKSILQKLRVSDRAAAIVVAVRRGIVHRD